MTTPLTRRDEVVDVLHGTKVADPYRWLEEQDNPEVRAWVAAQNCHARSHLDALPSRDVLVARLTQLWAHERRGVPARAGGRTFGLRNDGFQEHDVLWVSDTDGERVLVAPGESEALIGFEPSPAGRYVAVTVMVAGSDWTTIRVVDATDGTVLPDEARWIKLPAVGWLPDESGFAYVAFAPPAEDELLTGVNTGQQVRLHLLGRPEDVVLHEPAPTTSFAVPHVTEDGRLVVEEMDSTAPNRILIGAMGARLKEVVAGTAVARFLGVIGTEVFVQSHENAPNGRVIAIDVDQPSRVREVVAEGVGPLNAVFGGACLVGGHIVTIRTLAMTNAMSVTTIQGSSSYDVQLPGPGVVPLGVRGLASDNVFSFAFTSWSTPTSVLQHDLTTRVTQVFFSPDLPSFDPGAYAIDDVTVTSTGGVEVPVQLVRRRDITANGDRPVLVTGYGGFGVSYSFVGFQVGLAPWLEAGGVLVVAGLRGGGEYGGTWHDQGRLAHKQNVFDDALATSQWLIEAGWTSSRRLALTGQSNGGLLAGSVLVQRPDLFAAVVPEVAVLDMLRFHLFTGAGAWVPEYGCAEDPEQFPFLHAYSPLHNIVEGRAYPATLVVTGDHDDRVPPGVHSYKFAAALQHAQSGDSPVLLRVQTDAGHGGGKPVSMMVNERADVLAFLFDELGIRP